MLSSQSQICSAMVDYQPPNSTKQTPGQACCCRAAVLVHLLPKTSPCALETPTIIQSKLLSLLPAPSPCSWRSFSSPGTVDRLQGQTVKRTYQAHSYTIASPESQLSSLSHEGNETGIYFGFSSVKDVIHLLCPFTKADGTSGKSQDLEA